MRRIYAVLLLLVLPLTACSRAPAAVPAAPPATPPVVAEKPAPAPAVPSDAQCQFFQMLAAPRAEVTTQNGKLGVLGPDSCTYGVPGGTPLTLVVTTPEGKDRAGVRVMGTTVAGEWQGNVMTLKVTPQAGDQIILTLDAALGQNRSSVYTFRALPTTTITLSSGPAQTGPWAPVPATGFIPPEHGWLRAEWSRPGPLLTTPFVNWTPEVADGDRVAIYRQDPKAPVHELYSGIGGGDVRVQPDLRFVYWGAPPAVQLVAPAGEVRTVATLDAVPVHLRFDGTALLYDVDSTSSAVDLTTGKVTAGAGPPAVGTNRNWRDYPSPDGKRMATIRAPGDPDTFADRIDPVDLVIREGDRELLRIPHWMDMSRLHPGCYGDEPGLGWRADGGALAAISAPREGLLQLKILDLSTKTSWVLAEAEGPAIEALESTVTWSPDSRYITFGSRLVDAQTGRQIAADLPANVIWSPDSRYLLTSQRHHIFTNWGKIGLVEAATGKRQELGHGQIVGWTPQGSGLIVRWDASAGIPLPARDCD